MGDQLFNTRLEEIRLKFVASLQSKIDEFETLMERIVADDDSAQALEELRNGVHKLRGVAPTLGLEKLGEHAASSEDIIIAMTRQDVDDPEAAAIEFLGSFRALVNEMREASGHRPELAWTSAPPSLDRGMIRQRVIDATKRGEGFPTPLFAVARLDFQKSSSASFRLRERRAAA